MTTILVTGGAGYIGSHAVRQLAAEGYHPEPHLIPRLLAAAKGQEACIQV